MGSELLSDTTNSVFWDRSSFSVESIFSVDGNHILLEHFLLLE